MGSVVVSVGVTPADGEGVGVSRGVWMCCMMAGDHCVVAGLPVTGRVSDVRKMTNKPCHLSFVAMSLSAT